MEYALNETRKQLEEARTSYHQSKEQSNELHRQFLVAHNDKQQQDMLMKVGGKGWNFPNVQNISINVFRIIPNPLGCTLCLTIKSTFCLTIQVYNLPNHYSKAKPTITLYNFTLPLFFLSENMRTPKPRIIATYLIAHWPLASVIVKWTLNVPIEI